MTATNIRRYKVERSSLTPWIGCSGVEDRFAAGNIVIHDALFYVLLLCWYTGVRREEICKLNLDDFKELDGIHYIEIRTTLTGRIKNASSKRPLPLCTELIRLGIVEYIGAMRVAGETLAFPEIMPGKPGRTLSDVFCKIWWWSHIRPLVPDLKRGQAMHSCRHSVSTELAEQDASEKTTDDLLGHKGKGERRARYAKRAKLMKLLALVDQIPVVTDHLQDVTQSDIQLLPSELRRPHLTRQKSCAEVADVSGSKPDRLGIVDGERRHPLREGISRKVGNKEIRGNDEPLP